MASILNGVAQGTPTDLLTSELDNLSSGAMSGVGSARNNVSGTANFGGYPRGKLMLTLAAPASALSAGAAVYLWFLGSLDGTAYEDGSASVTPARPADVIFPLNAVSTAQVVPPSDPEVEIPIGYFKPLAQAVGTGAALVTGNKITIDPTSVQA